MKTMISKARKGRGAGENPPNRFESARVETDPEHFIYDMPDLVEPRPIATEFFPDQSRSIITENDSPDVPFRYSINPYRGCEHGCAYCYARPGHEYLGLGAGIDFETKIQVKFEAPRILRETLADPKWQPQLVAISGVTDCYQPAERKFRLTRGLLEVLLEARQPCGIVTKNALILRDLDLIKEMAARNLIHVNISLTTLDTELARGMEPRTSSPDARLRAMRVLAQNGVPVRVIVAPVIPGLTDHWIPQVLEAASNMGASAASFVLLRLPLSVEPVFLAWLEQHHPQSKDRVLKLIRECRGGALSNSKFGSRMAGTGPYAEGIRTTFDVFARKFSLNRPLPELDFSQFEPPNCGERQLRLF